jgi:hypothetical protein
MLKIHSKVMTEWGEGTLISVETPFNGLCASYDQARCVVWFGSENPGKREGEGACWVSREISLKDLVEMNQENIRDEKINDILHA